MADDDSKDSRLITLGFLKGVLRNMGKAVRENVSAPTNERLGKLEGRIAALEAKSGNSDER